MNKLIDSIYTSEESDFYRILWNGEREFAKLPEISRKDFLRTPLSKRRYKNEKALVKIVHDADSMFFSEWSFADIARETYGLLAKRPMVYLSDPHEAIEKSMWCYERKTLPLIGEKDPDIAMFAAERYKIDSLISDATALPKLLPYLDKRAEPLTALNIIGDGFQAADLMRFKPYAKQVRLLLALPETGAFADAELAPTPRFKALSGCTIVKDGTLIISKKALLVTPIIRYRTAIPSKVYDGA